MRKRKLGRLGAVAAVFTILTVSACDDEEATVSSDAGAEAGVDGSVAETSASDGTTPPTDGSVVIDDADADAGFAEDSGIDINPPPIDGGKAFDFAPPYVADLGPSARSDAGHNFASNTPKSNPWRTRCVDCHKAGGTAASRPFFAAGSVYYLADAGPASMAEVRLKSYVNANAVSAYTDNDGNWFVPLDVAQDAGVQFSLRPGIRNATQVRMMGPSPAIGVCNQCHGGANYL